MNFKDTICNLFISSCTLLRLESVCLQSGVPSVFGQCGQKLAEGKRGCIIYVACSIFGVLFTERRHVDLKFPFF